MNANSAKPVNSGFFGVIGNALSGISNTAKQATGAVTSAVIGNNKNSKNNVNSKTNKNSKTNVNSKTNANPVTMGINAPTVGGAASVNYSVPGSQRQPSEAVMNYVTTADAVKPYAEMRNVAHGGKRRTHKRKSTGGRKSHKKHTKRCHTMKSKTHRTQKRRNRV